MRVTNFDQTDLVEPAWAIAIDDDEEAPRAHWLFGPAYPYKEHLIDLDASLDEWDVPSSDEWPDHVCTAVARFKLEDYE